MKIKTMCPYCQTIESLRLSNDEKELELDCGNCGKTYIIRNQKWLSINQLIMGITQEKISEMRGW